MKKIFALFLLFLFGGWTAHAQTTGSLTAQGSTCGTSPTSSLVVSLQSRATTGGAASGSASIAVSGTFSQTLTFYLAGGDGIFYAASTSLIVPAANTATAPGDWQINVAGFSQLCVMSTTYTSGTANISVNLSTISARSGGSGGSGSGSVGSGTTGQLAVYPSNGTSVQGDANLTDSAGVLAYAGAVTSSIRDKGGALFSLLAYGAICDGAHATADSAAFSAAMAAAKGVNGTVFVPSGTCNLNNSGGAFSYSAFDGALVGTGPTSILSCNTQGTDCLDFTSSTSLHISDLSVTFSAATSTRAISGYPINVNTSSNVTVNNVRLSNTNISGFVLSNSNIVKFSNIYVSGALADGIFTANNNDVQVSNLNCVNGGDACFEASYYDSNSQKSCSRFTINGISSNNDVSGFLINSCSQVTVSNFSATNSALECFIVQQLAATTTAVWPDDIVISNGVCDGTGYGTNALNSNTAVGAYLEMDNSTSTYQNIGLSNIKFHHIAGRAIEVLDSNTINLTTSNIVIDDAGNGHLAATGEAIYTDGYTIQMTGTYIRNAGTYAVRNHSATLFSMEGLTSINPQQLNAETNAFLDEASSSVFKMRAVTIEDTWASTSRSGFSSTGTGNDLQISGVTTYCTAACTTVGGSPVVTVETSGTAQTYTTPLGALFLKVEMCGGGGGGSGSGTAAGTGGNGTASTVGSSYLTANYGSGGNAVLVGGSGGSASGGDVNITGATGGSGASITYAPGQTGGSSPFGGAGGNGNYGAVGGNASANSCSGGGGAGEAATNNGGSGGGAGGYLTKVIASPAATYTYTVGLGGSAGTAGTGSSGTAGGTGAAGIIIFAATF